MFASFAQVAQLRYIATAGGVRRLRMALEILNKRLLPFKQEFINGIVVAEYLSLMLFMM
jgi:hypothetical protein